MLRRLGSSARLGSSLRAARSVSATTTGRTTSSDAGLSPTTGTATATADTTAPSTPPTPPAPPGKLNFDDAQLALRSKSIGELLLATAIFKLCSFQTFVRSSGKLLALSQSILGERVTMGIVRHTFFRHFCAGVDGEDIKKPVARLRESGIGAILDYAAEADVNAVAPTQISASDEEAACEANAQLIAECIEASSHSPDGFAAVKLTALGRAVVLERCSQIHSAIHSLFQQFDSGKRREISLVEFTTGLRSIGFKATEDDARALFDKLDVNRDGIINYLDWDDYLAVEDLKSKHEFSKVLPFFTDQERREYVNLKRRLDKIAELAEAKKVRLLVDAEQTYFQPAIDHIVIAMQRRHNTKFPIVFNTYQCYLKDARWRLDVDIQRARKEKFWFAAKLVRGAYMVGERARAVERGYEDPIQPSIEATHANYHDCLSTILDNVDISNVMVASHNQKTIEFTTQQLTNRNIAPSQGIFFGQLMGMADHLSFTLGSNGYKAYKYVPYGPVKEVIPYLIRRAQENSNLLGGAVKERKMFWDEFLRRTNLIPGLFVFSTFFVADYFL